MRREKGTRSHSPRNVATSPTAPRLELSSMLDVTFLLLIFFLCVIKFKNLEGRFDTFLPETGNHATPEDVEVPIDIRLVYNGSESTVYVGNQVVERLAGPDAGKTAGTEMRLPRLAAVLERLQRIMPDAPTIIDPRDGVPHGHVVAVVNTLMQQKMTDVRFTTRRG